MAGRKRVSGSGLRTVSGLEAIASRCWRVTSATRWMAASSSGVLAGARGSAAGAGRAGASTVGLARAILPVDSPGRPEARAETHRLARLEEPPESRKGVAGRPGQRSVSRLNRAFRTDESVRPGGVGVLYIALDRCWRARCEDGSGAGSVGASNEG